MADFHRNYSSEEESTQNEPSNEIVVPNVAFDQEHSEADQHMHSMTEEEIDVGQECDYYYPYNMIDMKTETNFVMVSYVTSTSALPSKKRISKRGYLNYYFEPFTSSGEGDTSLEVNAGEIGSIGTAHENDSAVYEDLNVPNSLNLHDQIKESSSDEELVIDGGEEKYVDNYPKYCKCMSSKSTTEDNPSEYGSLSSSDEIEADLQKLRECLKHYVDTYTPDVETNDMDVDISKNNPEILSNNEEMDISVVGDQMIKSENISDASLCDAEKEKAMSAIQIDPNLSDISVEPTSDEIDVTTSSFILYISDADDEASDEEAPVDDLIECLNRKMLEVNLHYTRRPRCLKRPSWAEVKRVARLKKKIRAFGKRLLDRFVNGTTNLML